jgi:hypothetical protein
MKPNCIILYLIIFALFLTSCGAKSDYSEIKSVFVENDYVVTEDAELRAIMNSFFESENCSTCESIEASRAIKDEIVVFIISFNSNESINLFYDQINKNSPLLIPEGFSYRKYSTTFVMTNDDLAYELISTLFD